MAKTQKPNDEEKIVKENVQKRFKNMFSGESEPPSNMSLKEVEALQTRVTELEALLEQQTTPFNYKPVAATPASAVPSSPVDVFDEPTVVLEKRIARWATGISAFVGLVFFLLGLYIVYGIQDGMWELSDKAILPFTALMFVTGLVGMNLVRRDRLVPGVWIPYLTSVILGPILVVLFIKNMQVIMGGYLILFSILFISLVFPKTSRLLAILAAVASAVIVAGLEIWNPPFRLSTENIDNFALMVAGPALLGILFLFFFANQLRHPGIQSRLTLLLMTIMIPVLLIISFLVSAMARRQMETGADSQLQGISNGLASGLSTWLELNTNALQDLTLQPDIISMDRLEQRPVLQAMAKAHPYMYLVSTTNMKGMNIARNDNGNLTNYSDRDWFKDIAAGAPVAYQSLIGKTTGQPALVISMPIKNASGDMLGVGMFAADLTDLSKEIQINTIGERGFTFLVDARNQTLAHPDEKVTAELQDMSEYPPVVALRQGKTGLVVFTDENGERWHAYITALENGWAIISQQPEEEILAPAYANQGVVTGLIMGGGIIMLILVSFITRRTLQPINVLTHTVSTIAAGDLSRVAEVSSRDEIGKLAHTFNVMTSQVRNLVGNLEQRVADRTHDLELAAEVGRVVTERVTELSEMLTEAVEVIRARFDLYYTQIYLAEPSGERLILRAGTGEVGKELLQRGHHLIISSGSLNGRAVIQKRAQVVEDTEKNPNFLPNRLLPKTRSEMSVPLIVAGNVVGVLDMQSEHPGALSETNLPAFEALAGQLAIAIRNASLFAEAEEARTEVETQIGRFTEQGWDDFMNAIYQGHKLGYAFQRDQVVQLKPELLSKLSNTDCPNLPITVTGTKVGEIQLPDNVKANELELVRAIGEQLAQHVENLRLLARAEEFRKEAELAVRHLTHEGWEAYLSTNQSDLGYVYDLNQVQPLSANNDLRTDQPIKQPLVIRDETIGELKLALPAASEETTEIISAVAQQLSGHLETLRLSELNEKHAQREQTLRQITSALRSSTNPTTIVRTAVREVGRILGRKTVVQITSRKSANQAEPALGNDNETDSPADQS